MFQVSRLPVSRPENARPRLRQNVIGLVSSDSVISVIMSSNYKTSFFVLERFIIKID